MTVARCHSFALVLAVAQLTRRSVATAQRNYPATTDAAAVNRVADRLSALRGPKITFANCGIPAPAVKNKPQKTMNVEEGITEIARQWRPTCRPAG